MVIDNGSTDGTCDEPFPDEVTLFCHLTNTGVGGAAATAFEIARAEAYDWVWALDQDSVAEPEALERHIDLLHTFSPQERASIGVLSSVIRMQPTERLYTGGRLTRLGVRPPSMNSHSTYYVCDVSIWSGALFNISAIRAAGEPRFGRQGIWVDFSMDYSDMDYIFRIKQASFQVLVNPRSQINHPVGELRSNRFASIEMYSTNHRPFRRYLYSRNMTYFWLHIYPTRLRPAVWFYVLARNLANSCKLLLLEQDVWRKLLAIWIGCWHGITRQLTRNCPVDPISPARTSRIR